MKAQTVDYSPQDLHLPDKFSAWQNVQYEALMRGVNAHLSGKRFVAQNRPVGTGKTVTGVAHGNFLVESQEVKRYLYLTPGKILQDQIASDFNNRHTRNDWRLVDMRGRDNYKCLSAKFKRSCAEMREHCGYTASTQLSVSNQCPYRYAKWVASNEPYVVSNYAFQLAAGSGIAAVPFDLLIADEAHVIEDQLTSFLSVELGGVEHPRDWKLMQLSKSEAQRLGKRENVTAKELGALAKAAIRIISDSIEAGDVYDQDDAKDLEDLLERLQKATRADDGWVVDQDEKTGALVLQPIWVGRYAELIWQRAKYVLLMSGTINRHTLRYLGVKADDVDYSEWDYVFPLERSPIYWVHTAQMTEAACRKEPSNVRVWLSRNEQIMKGHLMLGQSGLMHTVSFDRTRVVMDHLAKNPFFRERCKVFHNLPESRKRLTDVVAEYCAAAEAGQPAVLISPSITTGFDFKGVRARFNIIGKVPFEPGKGPLMQARKEQDKMYMNNRTAQTVVQTLGRGTRDAEDWCANYVTDDCVGWFKRYGLFPKYVHIQEVKSVPKPIQF